MKNISETFKNSLKEENLHLVKCYKINLINNMTMYFTEYSENLVIEGIVYLKNNLLTVKQIKKTSELENLTNVITGYIDEVYFKQNDINIGKFNNASIEIFLFDLKNNEKLNLYNGVIKSISINENIFIMNCVNSDFLENHLGDTFSPLCPCSFCDEKCQLNKDNFTDDGIISEIINNTQIITNTINIINKANNYYNNGIITFNYNNKAYSTEIKTSSGKIIIFKFPLPFQIQINKLFKITMGCDKNFITCYQKFKNAINFRGQPNIPRNEKIFQVY